MPEVRTRRDQLPVAAVPRLLLTALLLGVGAWYAGRLSRRVRVRRRRERAAAERWEGEGGATL